MFTKLSSFKSNNSNTKRKRNLERNTVDDFQVREKNEAGEWVPVLV